MGSDDRKRLINWNLDKNIDYYRVDYINKKGTHHGYDNKSGRARTVMLCDALNIGNGIVSGADGKPALTGSENRRIVVFTTELKGNKPSVE